MEKLLALVLVIVSVFVLASCNKNKNSEEREQENLFPNLYVAACNLEDAGYLVSYSDDEDDLDHPGILEQLYAEDESDNFLSVLVFDSKKLANLYYKRTKAELDFEIYSLKNEIDTIAYTLENYEENLDFNIIENYEEHLADLQEELEFLQNEMTVEISGSTVWHGTKNIINDARR